MSNNCIVVPLYKSFKALTDNELLSIKQLYKVLGSHPIYLIAPSSLEVIPYVAQAKKNGVDVKIKKFDDFFFDGVAGYNELLLSDEFYKAFHPFKFMLIYQTDAFVFRDELVNWCEKGFDYIGAPWSGIHLHNNAPLLGIGNGGFSLRSLNGAVKTLRNLRILEVLEHYKNLNWKGILPRLPGILSKLFTAPKGASVFERDYHFQEDIFWCISAPERLHNFTCRSSIVKILWKLLIRNDFKIAPEEMAVQFSIETTPAAFYRINHERLPFGCHAWQKYDPLFWKTFIPGDLQSV